MATCSQDRPRKNQGSDLEKLASSVAPGRRSASLFIRAVFIALATMSAAHANFESIAMRPAFPPAPGQAVEMATPVEDDSTAAQSDGDEGLGSAIYSPFAAASNADDLRRVVPTRTMNDNDPDLIPTLIATLASIAAVGYILRRT